MPLHLMGFVNQTRMPAIYAASDVLVLPSERETWGLVANEALACGRPVILSDAAGSAPDLLDDLSVGRIFRSGDVYGLADALCDIALDPPSPASIHAKSELFNLAAASKGILAAADYVLAGEAH